MADGQNCRHLLSKTSWMKKACKLSRLTLFIVEFLHINYFLIRFFDICLCLCHLTVSVKALCFGAVCLPNLSVCSSRSFTWIDLVTTIPQEQLEQSGWNLEWIFTSPYSWQTWLDSGGQRSRWRGQSPFSSFSLKLSSWSLEWHWAIDVQLHRHGAVVERRSLTGELSVSHAWPVADEWPLMWVRRPL